LVFENQTFFITLLVTTGVIFGALYALWLYNRIAFGSLKIFHLINYFTSSVSKPSYLKYHNNTVILKKNDRYNKVSVLQNDMNRREFAVFVPFFIMTLVMGIYPEIFMVSIHISTVALLENIVY
jgi:NADH:ubiquinone oxidoreductase subunit 4 (subunit M)